MANQYDADDFFDWDEGVDDPSQRTAGNGGGLRKLLEDALEENKQMRQQFNSLMQERQQNALNSKVNSRKLDPKVLEVIPKDLDAAGQEKWLDDYGQYFALKPSDDQTPAPAANTEDNQDDNSVTSTLTQSEIEALKGTTQEAAQSGSTNPATLTPIQKLNSFDNEDDFWAFVQSQP